MAVELWPCLWGGVVWVLRLSQEAITDHWRPDVAEGPQKEEGINFCAVESFHTGGFVTWQHTCRLCATHPAQLRHPLSVCCHPSQ